MELGVDVLVTQQQTASLRCDPNHFVLSFNFVKLSQDYLHGLLKMFKVLNHLDVGSFQADVPVDQDQNQVDSYPVSQVLIHHFLPLFFEGDRRLYVAVPGRVDYHSLLFSIHRVLSQVKIKLLGFPASLGDPCNVTTVVQSVNQGALANVGTPHEQHLLNSRVVVIKLIVVFLYSFNIIIDGLRVQAVN